MLLFIVKWPFHDKFGGDVKVPGVCQLPGRFQELLARLYLASLGMGGRQRDILGPGRQ